MSEPATPARAARAPAPGEGFPSAGLLGVDPPAALAAARSAAAQEISSASRVATGAVGDLAGSAAAAGSDLLGRAQSAAGAARDPAGQLGYLLEAIEERVVAELERRGGRYAGTF